MTTEAFTPSDRARQVWRLSLVALWTIVSYSLWLPGALATLGSPRRHQAWNNWIQRTWTRGLLRALGFIVEVKGTAPPKPFFMVANHLSYVDVLVFGSQLGATFISKAELRRWPVLGHLARVTGTLFIKRESRRDAIRVLEEIDRAMARGAGVVLFPEGTSSRGDQVHPLRPALLHWAATRTFPVHTATVSYLSGDPRRPADLAICWWGDVEFAPHLTRLLATRRPRALLSFHPTPVTGNDRRPLALALREQLRLAFIPIPTSEHPA